jgi:hypothetical protein
MDLNHITIDHIPELSQEQYEALRRAAGMSANSTMGATYTNPVRQHRQHRQRRIPPAARAAAAAA